MISVLQSISIGILVFFLIYCVATGTLLVMSLREISWYARGQEPAHKHTGLAHRPTVSLVTPAYNEETLIVQSAKAFLASDYAPLEVVVVDDGSRDETFARLVQAFDLVSLPLRGDTALKTAPIKSVNISRTEPRLRVGEDMEMTMRIHHLLRPQWKEARVEFAPDAVCWTEAPATMGGLRSQRVRWHAGLLDNLRMHWGMFGRPRFGAAGVFAMPYLVLFEALEPLIEILGFAIVITLIVLNSVNWTYLVAFFLIAVLTGELMSTTALLIEEIGFRHYRARDVALLTGWGLVESLWFRPALAWWRLKATVLALLGRRPGWGVIPRGEAILEQPAHAVAPLTR